MAFLKLMAGNTAHGRRIAVKPAPEILNALTLDDDLFLDYRKNDQKTENIVYVGKFLAYITKDKSSDYTDILKHRKKPPIKNEHLKPSPPKEDGFIQVSYIIPMPGSNRSTLQYSRYSVSKIHAIYITVLTAGALGILKFSIDKVESKYKKYVIENKRIKPNMPDVEEITGKKQRKLKSVMSNIVFEDAPVDRSESMIDALNLLID